MQARQRYRQLQERIEPLRDVLMEHPIYREIDGIGKLRHFMEAHVFAVWDFMSLAKWLQGHFCGTSLPWLPPENQLAARFISEIVLAEESDERDSYQDGADDKRQSYSSHFEIYLDAMQEAGAATDRIETFIDSLHKSRTVREATDPLPRYIRDFVRSTFATIEQGDPCAVAATFTFGREDLLPHVFQQIVQHIDFHSSGRLGAFRYYLQRHIELDGDQHGPMAEKLIESLCGASSERWDVAEQAAVDALVARKSLWDGMYHHMCRDVRTLTSHSNGA